MSKPKMSSVRLRESERSKLEGEARSQRRSLSAQIELRVKHSLLTHPDPLGADVVATLMQEEGK